MNDVMKIVVSIYSTFLVIFILFPLALEDVSGACPPATIMLDDTNKEANVAPGESGCVNFTGAVTVSLVGPGQNIQTVIVELSADCEDWRTELTPSTLYFTPEDMGMAKPFNLSVTVPLETDRNDNRWVEVSGIMTIKPGFFQYSLSPAMGLITIIPYCVMTFDCPMPEKKVEPGGSLDYDLLIWNGGNGDESFNISVSGDSPFFERCGAINRTDFEVRVVQYDEKRIGLTILIRKDAAPGIYQLDISASCSIYIEVEEDDWWEDAYWLSYTVIGVALSFVILVIILAAGRKKRLRSRTGKIK